MNSSRRRPCASRHAHNILRAPGAFRAYTLTCSAFLLLSCDVHDAVIHPTFADGGLVPLGTSVPQRSLEQLAGIYDGPAPASYFGKNPLVVHASPGRLSIFAQSNTAYAVLRTACIREGTQLVLEGEWRYSNATNTGLTRIFVEPESAATRLCQGGSLSAAELANVNLQGALGIGDHPPDDPISLGRVGEYGDLGGFVVAAHHGACRTIDDCGASENSLESLRMVEAFGASVVEIDVRLTADGVPILFHDETWNPRLSAGNFCRGAVADFPLAGVRALCTLRFGERIPTLAEALATIADETALAGVWLDVKVPEAVAPTIAAIEAERTRGARRTSIVVGLGSTEVRDAYATAPKSPESECLCELEPSDVVGLPCTYWGPRWTRGPMKSDVSSLQRAGHKVVYWTINEPEFMTLFLNARPNGILTDRTGMLLNKLQLMVRDGKQIGPCRRGLLPSGECAP